MIGQFYGFEIYCVAQGMDAVKIDNKLTFEHKGMLVFGERKPGILSEKNKKIKRIFQIC